MHRSEKELPELPKFVIERLRNSTAHRDTLHHGDAGHPDADLLTAFQERSLTNPEQMRVLHHLAGCSDCRELLAFSLPEGEEIRIPSTSAVRFHFLRPPIFRWAAVASAVAVLAVAVMVQRPQQTLPARSSATKMAAPQLPNPAREVVSAAQPPMANETRASNESKPSAFAALKESRPARRSAANTLAKKDAVRLQGLKSAAVATPSADLLARAESAAGRASETSEVGAVVENAPAGAVRKLPATVPTAQEEINSRADASPSEYAYPTTSARRVVSQSAAPGVLADAKTKKQVPPLRWSLSPSGGLLRSADGISWTPIAVGEPASFRVLSVIGTDIWAGGSAGTLFHSPDSGRRWQRIRPSVDGIELKDDITRLQFSDSRHGAISTSVNQRWMTDDGGQSWRKASQ